MNETAGSTATDSTGSDRDCAYAGGVALGQPSPVADGTKAIAFAGSGSVTIPHGATFDTIALTLHST